MGSVNVKDWMFKSYVVEQEIRSTWYAIPSDSIPKYFRFTVCATHQNCLIFRVQLTIRVIEEQGSSVPRSVYARASA
jgi:hypothetical protein